MGGPSLVEHITVATLNLVPVLETEILFFKKVPFALKKIFIYFWLHWVFFGLYGLSLVAKKKKVKIQGGSEGK